MHLSAHSVRVNPYLQRLTNGERDLGWLVVTVGSVAILWIIGCVLVSSKVIKLLDHMSYEAQGILALVGLPLAGLTIVTLIGYVVFSGAQFIFSQTGNDQLSLLRMTNISQGKLFWSLVLGILYRARYWILMAVGGGPLGLYLVNWLYQGLAVGAYDLEYCNSSPLGNVYCYFDAPLASTRPLEAFWFLCLSISVLAIFLSGLVGLTGLVLWTGKSLAAALAVLTIIVPLIMGIILVAGPEGYLYVDTVYKISDFAPVNANIINAGLLIAVLSLVGLLAVQFMARRRAFYAE